MILFLSLMSFWGATGCGRNPIFNALTREGGPEKNPIPLTVSSFTAVPSSLMPNMTARLTVNVDNPQGAPLTFVFERLAGDGPLGGENTAGGKTYTTGAGTVTAKIKVTVTTASGAEAAKEIEINVSDQYYTCPFAADTVVSAPGVTDPVKAVNGVRGAGQWAGSTDVCQLNYTVGDGNAVTLKWSHKIVKNGPGADFAVFENGFEYSGTSGEFFMDLLIVSVSYNGTTWVDFPYDYTHLPETVYSREPQKWSGFAGRTPVKYNEDTNRTDPFNPSLAGGDLFDLDSLPDTETGRFIKTNGFRQIRLTTAPSVTNPETGAGFVRETISNGADIDGVYARYFDDE